MGKHCKFKIPGSTVSLLSWTEDMDAWSFSLPAGRDGACPLIKDDSEKDICSGCYAQINRYNMPNVLKAQWVRFNWVKKLVQEDRLQEFVDLMVLAIGHYDKANGFFRWHDSGDLFHPKYIEACYQVCKQTDVIKHWFPTRSWRATSQSWREAFDKLCSLPNVTVRPSALQYNDPSPKIKGFGAGTTVITEENMGKHNVCPKTLNGGNCTTNSCRTCWVEKDTPVAYLVHGYLGSHKIPVISQKIRETRLTIKGQVV